MFIVIALCLLFLYKTTITRSIKLIVIKIHISIVDNTISVLSLNKWNVAIPDQFRRVVYIVCVQERWRGRGWCTVRGLWSSLSTLRPSCPHDASSTPSWRTLTSSASPYWPNSHAEKKANCSQRYAQHVNCCMCLVFECTMNIQSIYNSKDCIIKLCCKTASLNKLC